MSLRRTLTLPLTIAYGLGTILGAGVYVLVGKVAGYAGSLAPLSFLLAAIVATFTAISYARLCALYPKAAGEAVYVKAAFNRRWLTALTGWLVVFTGVVSAAALTRGFVGYFSLFFSTQEWVIMTALLICLTALACWGIGQSVWVATLITLIEVGGLVLVICVSPPTLTPLTLPTDSGWLGITLGAFLAFYAFIGFEDMVNLAEEVRSPHKTLPRAIFLALGLATLLYVLTALSALAAVPLHELVQSDAPLALLFEKRGLSPLLITAISLVAIVNGTLVQILMSARVLYGMATQKAAPRLLGQVGAKTQTPLLATLLTGAIILLLALFIPIVPLAQATSFVILIVFALVNLSLVILKKSWIAAIGCFLSSALIVLFFVAHSTV